MTDNITGKVDLRRRKVAFWFFTLLRFKRGPFSFHSLQTKKVVTKKAFVAEEKSLPPQPSNVLTIKKAPGDKIHPHMLQGLLVALRLEMSCYIIGRCGFISTDYYKGTSISLTSYTKDKEHQGSRVKTYHG